MRIKIALSRKEIADAILHNNEIHAGYARDKKGVFIWRTGWIDQSTGITKIQAIGQGVVYVGPKIYDPADFVEQTDYFRDCDTTQFRREAREEGVKEGRIRDVYPDLLNGEEEALVNEYADNYEATWRQELRYKSIARIEDPGTDSHSAPIELEIEWSA